MNPKITPFIAKVQAAFKKLVLDNLKDFGFGYNPEYDSDLDDPTIYDKSGGILYLLKVNDQVLGSIAVINKGEMAELKRWYVSKKHQGKGFGTALMDKAIEFCERKDLKRIEFETNRKFTKAHELYKKRGFK